MASIGGLGGLGDIVAFVGVSGDAQFIGKMQAMDSQAQATSKNVDKALKVSMVAAAAAIGIAAGAAIKFESSFAGVTKTVDGLRDPMGNLNAEGLALAESFRKLSLEVPISVNELNKIGELGGQLGIAKSDLIGFTDTIAKLGVTTDLTIEAAASSMARFVNITQKVAPEGMTAAQQIERLGSTVVDLGNNFATTESAILEMSSRIAGAGSQVGLSQSDIMAFSAALSSVGVEAQAGGTSISKAFIKIAQSVANGDDNLGLFAKTAGKSIPEFSKLFEEDAAGAMVSFFEGLDNVSESGGNVFGVLEQLGITETRLRDVFLRASSASGIFTSALKKGKKAFEDNNALAKEADQRFGTMESQLKLVGNILNDAFIDIGHKLLPVFKSITTFFKENPQAIADFVKGLGSVVIAAGLVSAAIKIVSLRLATGMKAINASIGLYGSLVIAIIATVNAADQWKDSKELERKATEDANEVIKRGTENYMDMIDAVVELGKHGDDFIIFNGKLMKASEASYALGTSLEAMSKSGSTMGGTVELSFNKVDIAAAQAAKATAIAAAKAAEQAKKTGELTIVTEELKKRTIETVDSINKEIAALEKDLKTKGITAGATRDLTNEIKDLEDRLKPTITAEQLMTAALSFNAGIMENVSKATDKAIGKTKTYEEQLKDTKEAQKKMNDQAMKAVGAFGAMYDAIGGGDSVIDGFVTSFEQFASGNFIGGTISALGALWEAMAPPEMITRTQAFSDASIKTEDSVKKEIAALSDLAANYELTDFELEQVLEKIRSLNDQLGKTTYVKTIEDLQIWSAAVRGVGEAYAELYFQSRQVADNLAHPSQATNDAFWEMHTAGLSVVEKLEKIKELMANPDASTEWLEFLTAKSDELTASLQAAEDAILDAMGEAVQSAIIATAAEIAALEGQIAVWEQQMKDIDLETEKNIAPLNDELDRLSTLIADLQEQKINIQIQADTDIAEQQAIITAYTTFIEKMKSADNINLDNLHDELEETLGLTKAITISFGEMNAAMLQDYTQFEKDMQAVNDAIDDLTFFEIDFDTTTADEQINSAIIRMQDYLATLTPGSPAYDAAKKALDAMSEKFTDMGGEIDRDKAYEFDISEAERKAAEAEAAIGDISTKATEDKGMIDLDISQLHLKIFQAMQAVKGWKTFAEGEKASIQIKIDDAKLEIDELLTYMNKLTDTTVTIKVRYELLNSPPDGLTSLSGSGVADILASPEVNTTVNVPAPVIQLSNINPLAEVAHVDNVVDPRQLETSRFTIKRGSF